MGGGVWIFGDVGRWSRLFRGRIRGLGLGRVRLVFLPVLLMCMREKEGLCCWGAILLGSNIVE